MPWALRRDHLDGTDFEVFEDYLEGKRGVEMELVLAGLIQKTYTIRHRLAGFIQKQLQFGVCWWY